MFNPLHRYNPYDNFWRADDGRVYSSKTQSVTNDSDPVYKALIAGGRFATIWPRDDDGKQTNAALLAVVSAYGFDVK